MSRALLRVPTRESFWFPPEAGVLFLWAFLPFWLRLLLLLLLEVTSQGGQGLRT